MSTAEIHTVDSAFMIEFRLLPGGILHVEDLSEDTFPHDYTPPHSAHLYYYTNYGVWRRTAGNGKWEFDNDMSGRNYRPAIVRECGIPLGEKHDDMVDACAYAINSMQQRVAWDKSTKGGNEMTKRLYHVILFNKRTEEIDFKAYIPSKDETTAGMVAVQTYGKYDANVHMPIVKYIDDSDYEKIELSAAIE